MRATIDEGRVAVRHVERVMGTVVSLHAGTRRAADGTAPLRAAMVRAVSWLHEVDDRFTTYRESEWLRVARGALDVRDAHPDVAAVLDACDGLHRRSRGAFDIAADPDRPADAAAYVKGWAVQRAADLLIDAGATEVAVNGGGDVVVHGGARPWRVGIQSPFARDAVHAVLEIDGGAVATSGCYERGAHLFDPVSRRATTSVASVTVVGPDLGVADACSTALFVDGPAGFAWFDGFDDYAAYLIHPDGTTTDRGLRRAGPDQLVVAGSG